MLVPRHVSGLCPSWAGDMHCSACELKANDHVDDSTNQITCPWDFPDVHLGRTAGTGSQGHERLFQYFTFGRCSPVPRGERCTVVCVHSRRFSTILQMLMLTREYMGHPAAVALNRHVASVPRTVLLSLGGWADPTLPSLDMRPLAR